MTDPTPDSARVEARNDIADLRRVQDAVETYCARHGATERLCSAVRLVVEELLVNVSTHAWVDGGEHRILFDMSVADGRLALVVSDDGVPYDPTARPAPDVDAPLEERAVGGLGVHLVRKMMDLFIYERRDGHNVVTLIKTLE